MLIRISLAEDTIIIKCARLINQLLNKNPTTISIDVFRNGLGFLVEFINTHKFVGICDALQLMQALIKNHFKNETITIGDESNELCISTELLLKLINDPDSMQKTTSCHYDGYSSIEIKSSAAFCLETILTFYEKLVDSLPSDQLITETLLKLIYSIRLDELSEQNYCVLMRSALISCRYIGFSNKIWCTQHIGDILGACVSNMLYGLPDYAYQPAQKVQSSQQSVQDSNNSNTIGKKGGKMIKGRKPRQTPQYKSRKTNRSYEVNNKNGNIDEFNESYSHSILYENPGTYSIPNK